MCDNIIVLYIFMFIKIVAIIILPFLILIKRKKEYKNILIIIEIVLLLFLLICNLFTINKCVYNSTLSGVQRTKNKNKIVSYNEMHPKDLDYSSSIKPEKDYKTYTGKNLYYFNQNRDYMKKAYYECGNNKVYMNSIGSSITAFSISISTLYDKSINPIQILNYYKNDNKNICNEEITIEKLYNSIMKKYGAISIRNIQSSQIESSIKNGGLVIAQLSANEDSKLTCDSNYIVIYNIDPEGKYKIADPALQSTSFVCPYSSDAYGNVIKSSNMEDSWTLEEINNEAENYYLVRRG